MKTKFFVMLFCLIAVMSSGYAQEAGLDKKPTFQGGDQNNFTAWVTKNIKLIPSAFNKNGEVQSLVSFTVNEEGNVVSVKVLRGTSADADKEAIRVVTSSPKWEPAEKNGKAVPVTFTLPIIISNKTSIHIYEEGKDDTVPFSLVENKPIFQGGDQNKFMVWVNENIKFPKEGMKGITTARIVVQFTVTAKGNVDNVKVLRGVNAAVDAEAIRVVSASPDWIPGKVDGKPVNVTFTFPIIFTQK